MSFKAGAPEEAVDPLASEGEGGGLGRVGERKEEEDE